MRYKYKRMCAYDDSWEPTVKYNYDPGTLHHSWFGFVGAI